MDDNYIYEELDMYGFSEEEQEELNDGYDD